MNSKAIMLLDLLKSKFLEYCCQNEEMERSQFLKLIRDLNLLDTGELTLTDIDLKFLQLKPKSCKRINFDQFVVGLDSIAGYLQLKPKQILDIIAAHTPTS